MMAMVWSIISRWEDKDGVTTKYKLHGTDITIESRKRAIPHANRGGFWYHTTFFVLCDGVELVEKQTLKDAKKYAEDLARDQEGKI